MLTTLICSLAVVLSLIVASRVDAAKQKGRARDRGKERVTLTEQTVNQYCCVVLAKDRTAHRPPGK